MYVDDLILASASPRRSQLLQQLGVRFLIEPAHIDEICLKDEAAVDFVTRMALEKAYKVSHGQSATIPVLGADTIVLSEGNIFSKPESYDQAREMLLSLSDNHHQVLSSVAIVNGEKSAVLVSETKVWFRTVSEAECLAFWRTGEPEDKAGAYAIQGYGAVFVERIEGSYSGVVGLPIAETSQLLHQFEIPMWQS